MNRAITNITMPWPIESDSVWKARAKQAINQSRQELDRIPPNQRDIGDPNHPIYSGIFGYDKAEFMAKQHK